jgi:hypothetical protein
MSSYLQLPLDKNTDPQFIESRTIKRKIEYGISNRSGFTIHNRPILAYPYCFNYQIRQNIWWHEAVVAPYHYFCFLVCMDSLSFTRTKKVFTKVIIVVESTTLHNKRLSRITLRGLRGQKWGKLIAALS